MLIEELLAYGKELQENANRYGGPSVISLHDNATARCFGDHFREWDAAARFAYRIITIQGQAAWIELCEKGLTPEKIRAVTDGIGETRLTHQTMLGILRRGLDQQLGDYYLYAEARKFRDVHICPVMDDPTSGATP